MPHTVFDSRITALRQVMAQHNIDACVVLSSDPHLSEYLPEYWQVRQWLSGFDGSAGTLVVQADFAGLWVDSRYWEQADSDLAGSIIQVMRAGAPDVPGPSQWLARQLDAGQCVWLDARTVSVQAHKDWVATLEPCRIRLAGTPDLLGPVWSDRPALPAQPVYEHAPPFACRTRAENLAAVRAVMHEQGAQWHILSSLDDIAWLLNLRGFDIPYNPVFLAYMLIGPTDVVLFVAPDKLSSGLVGQLSADHVQVQGYDAVQAALAAIPATDAVLFDGARTTQATRAMFQHAKVVESLNPSQRLKAQKNAAEIDNVRRTMEADGAALCEFFSWFEATLGVEPVTELTVDEHITGARSRQPGFVSPSFGTIAGFNGNGAMPHYQARSDSHAQIDGDGLLLIDSGGQYQGGTTDITRVVPVGQISAQQRRDFTLVLRGMIALSQAHFPVGTPGCAIDAIARMPLWQDGLDYGHGTGHGVGYFMNVHEGPQSISPRMRADPDVAMLAGMITSNEPGLYRPGQWGIRIENLVLAVPAADTEFGQFLRFETLTLCPIDTRCVDPALLSASDIDWLNSYHDKVRMRLEPLVSGKARTWLLERTRHI